MPSKSNCYRIANNRLFKSKALTEYENKFYIQCKNRGANIREYFEIEIDVFYPSERSDLDNSLKILMDSLQACGVIKNDNKCTRITAQKFVDKKEPRVEITLLTVKP